MVVAKLKLSHVERQVFAADLVIGADHAALEDAPEAFNRVRVIASRKGRVALSMT
jgi:hypothetical protein